MPDEDFANLPPPTAPASFLVSVNGRFDNEEEGKKFANDLHTAIQVLSCYLDLDRLDGVTVADDYDRALEQLDRGFQKTRPLTRSNDEHGVGVAMAPAVLRDGVVKAHLVFYTPVIRAISEINESPQSRLALNTIAHECGHIEDLKHRDTCFPGVILQQPIQHYDDAAIEQVAEVIWEEYAACRASARFGGREQTSAYATTMNSLLPGARSRSNAAIREFRLHGDVNRGVQEAGGHICEPLRRFAYLQGNLDGLELELTADAPEALAIIDASPYAHSFAQGTEILRELWMRRGKWSSQAEFDPLRILVRKTYADGGVIFIRKPDGNVRVELPFRPGTIPGDE